MWWLKAAATHDFFTDLTGARKEQKKNMEFFLPMIPPTVTDQEHRIHQTPSGKVIVYDSPELSDAKAKLIAHLSRHRPQQKYTTPVRLVVKWLFPVTGDHRDGEYNGTRPDTDNLNKALKDCMTKLGFWKDDALVASEIIEKFYASTTGIYIRIMEL